MKWSLWKWAIDNEVTITFHKNAAIAMNLKEPRRYEPIPLMQAEVKGDIMACFISNPDDTSIESLLDSLRNKGRDTFPIKSPNETALPEPNSD